MNNCTKNQKDSKLPKKGTTLNEYYILYDRNLPLFEHETRNI